MEKIFGEIFAIIVAQKDQIYSDPFYLAKIRQLIDNFDELAVDLQSAYDQFVAERKNQQSATETTQESRSLSDSQEGLTGKYPSKEKARCVWQRAG